MRTSIQKLMLATVLLSAGMLVGLVISGRLGLATPGTASPAPIAMPAPQTRPAVTAAAASTGGLPNLSDIAERALKVSVNISSNYTERGNNPMFRLIYGSDPVYQSQSAGSGVIVAPDGYILTNNHVIGNANAEIKATLSDGVERPARIIGIDEVSDLAVLKVDAKNLDTLPWGDSSKLRVAEWVLAIGNPFQLGGTVTLGIVSTVSRPGGLNDFIQTDAAINPGNSGGALVNARGELVGINTQIVTETGGYQGIGLAIPSNLASSIWTEIKSTGKVIRGTLGFTDLRVISAEVAEANGLGRIGGVLVYNLGRRSTGLRAGVQRFDIITAINGQPVADANQLMKVVYNAKIGSTVSLDLSRAGRRMKVDVVVEELTAAR